MNTNCQSASTTFIYALVDPRTSGIRYIGKADDPERRLRQHVDQSKRGKYHRACWIRTLLSSGLLPVIQIVDEVLQTEWQSVEAAYIEYFINDGCDLVNGTPGGEGFGSGERHPMFGKPVSQETKAKLRALFIGKPRPPEVVAKLIGRKRSAETKNKISLANRGRRFPPEYGARMSLARRGMKLKLSPEQRASIIRRNKDRICSAETRERMRNAQTGPNNHLYGKHLSQETKAKISAALHGRQRSPEHCARLSAAKLGKPIPLEQRAKISATLKGRRVSQITRDKISATMAGRPRPWACKPLSAQHRAKIKAALTGLVMTSEQRARISTAITEWHKRRRMQKE